MEHWREGGKKEEGKSEEKARGMNSEASRAELSWK